MNGKIGVPHLFKECDNCEVAEAIAERIPSRELVTRIELSSYSGTPKVSLSCADGFHEPKNQTHVVCSAWLTFPGGSQELLTQPSGYVCPGKVANLADKSQTATNLLEVQRHALNRR